MQDDSFAALRGMLKKGRENLANLRLGTTSEPSKGRALSRSVTLFEGHVDGEIAEKFDLGKELGRGAFGRVVVAKEKATGMEYACKIVPLKNISSAKALQALVQEAEVMLHLRGHPHILKIHSFFEDTNNLYVVEELCSGGDLVEAVTSSSMHFTERVAASVMQKILESVAHCHALGVIHRDIKLDNFLLSGGKDKSVADQLRLADFGCSEFTHEKELISESAGTLEYMAPEVFAKSYAYPADVWSCGVVMYAMLCGRFPFESHSDPKETARIVATAPIDTAHGVWRNISPEAKACVSALLEKDPAKRPTAAKAIELSWFHTEGVARDKPLERPVRLRIKEFAAYSRFKQEVLRLVAAMMDDKSQAGFKRMYSTIGGGKERLKLEVAEASLVSHNMPKEEIDLVRSHIRIGADGCIDFNEFIAVVAASSSGVKMAGMLEQIFAIFDPENSGFITTQGVMDAFKMANREEIEHVMEEAGAVEGKMSKDDFYDSILGSGGKETRQGEYIHHAAKRQPRGMHVSSIKPMTDASCSIM